MTRAICPTPLAADTLRNYLDEQGYTAIVADHMGVPTVEAECSPRVMANAPGGLVDRYYRT